jgi:hypothetical protein
VLPLLYLHGLSSSDFVPALGQFLGSTAGLSASVITRLTEIWKAEQRVLAARDLSGVDHVYVWADAIHVNIGIEGHKLCLLVLIGVRADGRKELAALADGYRESTSPGPTCCVTPPAAACALRCSPSATGRWGAGALGFWAALREVFSGTREQRCWFHQITNVLAALPKSAQPGRRRRSGRSTTPRTPTTPAPLPRPSPPPPARSSPRRSPRLPTTRRATGLL